MASYSGNEQAKMLADTYKELCKIPTVAGGHFSPIGNGDDTRDHLPVSLTLSQKDVVTSKKRTSTKQFQWTGSKYEESGFPSEVSDAAAFALSPSRKYLACVKYLDSEKSKTALQIWQRSGILKTIPTSIVKHGAIYVEGIIGGLAWSVDEAKIAYVAEKKMPENETFFTPECESNKKSTRGKEFDYVSDWGELYSGKKKSEIFVADLKSNSISPVKGMPNDLMPGQVQWTKDGKSIIFTGWKIMEGIKLGFVYCFNRESHIYQIDVDCDCDENDEDQDRVVCITPEEPRARSPRITPDGSKVIFLSTRLVVSHNTCCKMMELDLSTRKVRCVVDVVEDPDISEFPGIYCISLPRKPFSDNGESVILQSQWRSHNAIVKVNLETCKLERVLTEKNAENGSLFLLDVYKNHVLAYSTSPVDPFSVLTHDLQTGKTVEVYRQKCTLSEGLSWTVEQITPEDAPKESHTYEAIVFKSSSPGPLIAFPHGGPHGSSSVAFSINTAFFVVQGFTVISLNYRGSVGFGLGPLESLLGNVARQDVDDCQNAVLYVAQKHNLDKERAFVMGGSHGGFLTCHLIAQFPDFYKAAIARNPVTDFPAAVRTSDIPDWVYAESLGCGLKPYPSEEDLKIMFERSPISIAQNVKTPLLLNIGKLDARVHPSQGFAFYRILKSLKVEVGLYFYPDDSHPIDSVNADSDAHVNMILWFLNNDKQ
eukprot:Nk52_evm22s1444 gene=Nk52_evmTU22s1444